MTDYAGTIYRIVRTATDAEPAPEAGGLRLAGPNPFRDRTALALGVTGPVRVVLVDVRGREVAVLWDGPAPPRSVPVDASTLAPGVYAAVATTAHGERTSVRLVRVR